MLDKLGEILLKSKIEKANSGRKRSFLPWHRIEKIALIINKEEALNKSAIDAYIERTKKHVEVFHIELSSKEPSYSDWECFASKDKSLLKMPKNKRLSALKNKEFDLVINTCENEFFSSALSSSLSAPLKCGAGSQFSDSDLIIKKTTKGGLLSYLDDVVTYLKMIKS